MNRWISRIGRAGSAAALVAALGFGGIAAAAQVPEDRATDHCRQGPCNASCRASGAQYGFCDSVGCVCVL